MIRRFLFEILVYTFLLALVINCFEFASSSYLRSRANFKIETSTESLVLGHSHPECAFNDSLLPSIINLAESGESYFYTFAKAKMLLNQNPSIDNIFIEFTNNQIKESANETIWSDKYLSYRLPRYCEFLTSSEKLTLMKKNLVGFGNAYSLSARNRLTRVFKNDMDYTPGIGGFKSLNRAKTDSLLNHISSKPLNRTTVLSKNTLSEMNLDYLDSLISLGKKKNCEVILMRSPLHKSYEGYANEPLFQSLLKNRFGSTTFLDFADFPATNDQFADFEHLNKYGARDFSIWFEELLESGLLKKDDKQNHIDQSIKKYSQSQEIR